MADDSYARKNGHPPVAAKTVCIDLDRTIIPWGALETIRKPYPGVAAAIRDLKDRGYRVVILTSRLSRRWWQAEAKVRGVSPWDFGRQQREIVERLLRDGGVPYDLVTAEKVPALAYFDDKAVRVDDQLYTLPLALYDFMDGLFQ